MSPQTLFWLIPALVVAADIGIRTSQLARFTPLEWVFYAVSILFSFLVYKAVFAGLHALRHAGRVMRKAYLPALFLVAFLYTTVILVSYGYYLKMGVMPNYFTFEFMRIEPHNSWTLVRDSLTAPLALGFLAFGGLLALALHRATAPQQRPYAWPAWGKAVHACLIVLFTFINNNNVRFVDQCFVSDINAISFAGRNLYNQVFHKPLGSTGLQARNRILLKERYANPGYNVLFIMGESLRKQNMQAYGYARPNAPFLSRLLQTRPGETFQFNHHFCNSTATLLAYPGLQNGVSPAQSSLLCHSAPLLFEYAKALGYQTFLISSHDYNFYNFRSFFNCPDIDVFWDKRKSGLPAVNDLGIDDSIPVTRALAHIDSLADGGAPFMGVIHLNTNHYPYHTPPAFRKWRGAAIDNYDNTILYQDDLAARVFNHLESKDLLKRTMVVFVSDHGEAFGEHGFVGHRGFYYLELLQIPLILYIPAPLQAGFDIAMLRANQNRNTTNLDIVPTYLDLLRISDKPAIAKIRTNLLGKSLFAPIDPQRDIIIANNNTIARYHEGVSFIRGNLHYLYQLNKRPHKSEVYDIVKDPEERNNLWATLPDSVKQSCLNVFSPYPVLMEVFKQ